MPPKSVSMQLSFLFVVGFSTDTSLRKQAKKRHIWLQFQLRKSVGKLFADSLNFQNFVFRNEVESVLPFIFDNEVDI